MTINTGTLAELKKQRAKSRTGSLVAGSPAYPASPSLTTGVQRFTGEISMCRRKMYWGGKKVEQIMSKFVENMVLQPQAFPVGNLVRKLAISSE